MEQKREKPAERLRVIGKHILEATRDELYINMRYLVAALHALAFEMNRSIKFTGTDGDFIYYNPAFLMAGYEDSQVKVNRAYLHMLFHCIFRHIWMRGDRKEEYWNLACDIAVEAVIDSLEISAVRWLSSDLREQWYEKLHRKLKVLTAEGIYQVLWNQPFSGEEYEQLCAEFYVDDHRFWENEKREKQKRDDNEDMENSERNTDEQQEAGSGGLEAAREQLEQSKQSKWKHIEESMKTNLETFAAQAGDAPAQLTAMLRVELRERYDYRSFLKRFAVWKEEMRTDEDSFDMGYYTFGLSSYGNLPFIEPLEYKENKKIEEFVIVIDTSGSCSGELVKRFLTETYALLKDNESFFRSRRIHLLQCDARVWADDIISSEEQLVEYMEEIKITGSGGTDFRPAFRYVEELKEKGILRELKGLLYFTDGYGTFPEKRPSFDTAFLFYREDYSNVCVPPWAVKLIIGEDF